MYDSWLEAPYEQLAEESYRYEKWLEEFEESLMEDFLVANPGTSNDSREWDEWDRKAWGKFVAGSYENYKMWNR